MALPDNLVKLCSDLICQKTAHDNPQALKDAIRFCADFFDQQAFQTKIFTHNGFETLLVTGKMTKKINVLFHGHLDVVAAHDSQFNPMVKGDKLVGRGSMDMKGAIAVMMMIAKKHLPQTNHALLLSTDEEIGGRNGCGYLIEEKLISCNYFITGEPTDLQIADEEKGVIWCTVKLKGSPTHASTPWQGKSAVVRLETFLAALKKEFPSPQKEQWITTVSPTIIQSTNSQNQIPGEIIVKLDSRYIPEDNPQKIITRLRKMSDGLEIQNIEPPLGTISHPYTDILKTLTSKKTRKMHFASDARFFYKAGIPSIILGPQGGDIHGDTEWVSISSLVKYFELLETFIQQL